jgi:undecaprenyl phosphate N,N'-diacetylbacillosamine 1-phosphate transferase
MILLLPNKGRVFFIQLRTGRNGKIFKLLKFKTMADDSKQGNGNIIWKFLRKTHLDELPQIANVFIGDMSLVGPRPLLPGYLPYYTKESIKYRNTIKPGITGLTQVSGGKYLPWSRRFQLDLFYIHHLTFKFDLFIIGKTIAVFFRSIKSDKHFQISNDISYIDYINTRLKQ